MGHPKHVYNEILLSEKRKERKVASIFQIICMLFASFRMLLRDLIGPFKCTIHIQIDIFTVNHFLVNRPKFPVPEGKEQEQSVKEANSTHTTLWPWSSPHVRLSGYRCEMNIFKILNIYLK